MDEAAAAGLYKGLPRLLLDGKALEPSSALKLGRVPWWPPWSPHGSLWLPRDPHGYWAQEWKKHPSGGGFAVVSSHTPFQFERASIEGRFD